MSSDVKEVLKRSTECVKTLTVGSFRSYSHMEKKQEYWSTKETIWWILEFAQNTKNSILFAMASSLRNKNHLDVMSKEWHDLEKNTKA